MASVPARWFRAIRPGRRPQAALVAGAKPVRPDRPGQDGDGLRTGYSDNSLPPDERGRKGPNPAEHRQLAVRGYSRLMTAPIMPPRTRTSVATADRPNPTDRRFGSLM